MANTRNVGPVPQKGEGITYVTLPDGLVLSVIELDDKLPWTHRSKSRSKWSGAKQKVLEQEVGKWYAYGGFADSTEAESFRSSVNRDYGRKANVRFETSKGKDEETDEFYVCIRAWPIEKDNPQD